MRSGRTPAAAALVVLGWCVATGVAAAHDDLVSSTPADGQSVATSPEKVELEFSGELQSIAEGVALLVTGPDGEVVTGDLEVEGPYVRLFLRSVLPEAEYRVAYRVVSSDGHVVTGSTRFFVGPVPADTGPASAPQDRSGAGMPVGVVIGVGVIAAITVSFVVLRSRPSRGPT